MNLIYLDESGTNYKIQDGLYPDGPFLIMGAMLINEDVYWSMERLFTKLIDKYFNIGDWLDTEIHATDIWHGNSLSSQLSIDDRRSFFDEFLQLCGKFALPYVFSFILKQHNQGVLDRNRDMLRAASCLLSGVETNLAKIHQTGILICDSYAGTAELSIKRIRTLDIEQQPLSPPQALLKQFYEMTSWRSIEKIPSFTLQPKYTMEAMSAYLIDRVHFLHSYDSLFLQICDIMTYIVQRSLVHDYLLAVHKDRIDPDKVPITLHGLDMMKEQMFPIYYDKQTNDIAHCSGALCHTGGFLFNFSSFPAFTEISDHYKQMQPME